MGYGQAQVFVGVHWRIVDANFVVEMRASGASAEAHIADGVAAVNVLAGGDGEARKMAVAGRNSVSMIDHDGAAIAAEEVGEGHGAIRGCNHRGAHIGGNIYAGVESA